MVKYSPPENKPKKHYRSREQAIKDGWPDKLQGVRLELEHYNHLADMAQAVLRSDPLVTNGEILAVSLAAFKRQYEIRDSKWQPKAWIELQSGKRFRNKYSPQPVIENKRTSEKTWKKWVVGEN